MRPMDKTIDSHAHVFTSACRVTDNPRHRPRYEAPLATYLERLDTWGISHAVLVQPSFLGTDNSYLMDCLREHPDRLRGVAVVGPDVTDASLDSMQALGIRGTRLNWIGQRADALDAPAWQALFRRLKQRGWHLEVQAEGPALLAILDRLAKWHFEVVVDHFGRPRDSAWRDPVVERLCNGHDRDRFWVKCSAPYRSQAESVTDTAKRLLDTLGPQRLMWGSDWPWTQHEHLYSFDKALEDLQDWAGDDALTTIAWETPCRFYGFERTA
ncbi:amidohydrolase family protein [Modicisalibacter coralii]|uniref:amidohydrolase family protein n=1 Tax=Modicisalibacter coralii TaxID=2304602 RepID=UPI00100B486B|nr:amidohydrolase family protein [Halomonas coralii]